MTKQEALEVIERFGVDSRGYPKLKEALDMAIEALQEQDDNPCENCQEFDCYGCEYKG